ncbi:hypothetical protein QJS10_CPA05g00487 [Acorus calamus]|uniref:DNA-directed DNA polymerase n=1 Tax=Acorus calamus TaxID=4465 RepID=A0AAV9EUV7_ACOCL|nr:hypothetical protein QJS10_CPA05g00487 [Acorus calamus]
METLAGSEDSVLRSSQASLKRSRKSFIVASSEVGHVRHVRSAGPDVFPMSLPIKQMSLGFHKTHCVHSHVHILRVRGLSFLHLNSSTVTLTISTTLAEPPVRLSSICSSRQKMGLNLAVTCTFVIPQSAGFSGHMPCVELADSIVQCGRPTLEKAILFVNTHETWRARVIHGDTDSMFVLLKGRSMEEAFRIGHEIASSVTAMNPSPVTLEMEKVYQPCVLLTKKRYVGYSYESPDQGKPVFDAKGIETVRRDACPAVAKALERSLKILFEEQDILKVKLYLERQWTWILSGTVSIQDFVFAKESYFMVRVPYVVFHGEPGARLIDMVLNPLDFLEMNSPYRLNDLYYINKQIIPALQRVFGIVGADLNQWFLDMPRPIRSTLTKRHYNQSSRGSVKSRIDNYYLSKHCALCSKLVQASSYLCEECSIKEPIVATALIGRTSKLERDIHHLSAVLRPGFDPMTSLLDRGGANRLKPRSMTVAAASLSQPSKQSRDHPPLLENVYDVL